MSNKYFWHIVIPMFTLGVLGIFNLVRTSDYYWLFATLGFWIFLSGLGIAVGYHRVFSHRCYDPKPWLDNLLLLAGTLACQTSSINWTAIHIGYHHPHSDKEKDFHSPTKGIWSAFLGWTFKITPQTVNYKYAVKLLRKENHLFFHQHYFKIVWGFALILAIVDWRLMLYGYSIAALWSIVQDNLVNIVGHAPKIGYRNFETGDKSSNFPLLGYLGWGQGWHNNHHALPAKFNFGVKWWEIDLCIIFIPLLKLGSLPKK